MGSSVVLTTRRRALAASIGLLGVAGCRGDRGQRVTSATAGSSSASGESGETLSTDLGFVRLQGAAVLPAWRPVIVDSAARVADIWGRAPNPLAVRVVTSDSDFAAAADALDGDTAAVTTPQGILIGPAVARTMNGAGQRVVMAHELTHARLGQYGADRTPLWVREGLAEWTALRGVNLSRAKLWPHLTKLTASGELPTRPPSDAEFDRDRALAYETAAAWCTYLASTAGADAVKSLAGAQGAAEVATRRANALVPKSAPSFASWLHGELR